MRGLEELSGDATASMLKKGRMGTPVAVDDDVLYQAFVWVFNAVVENKEYFIGK